VISDAAASERAYRRRERRTTRGLLGVPLIWLLVFFVLPVAFIAAYSLGGVHLFPTDRGGMSVGDWDHFLFGGSIYMRLFWKSIAMSLGVSVFVTLLAYPVAYFLAFCTTKRKFVLLLVIIVPFLTSYLLRVLAWKVILGDSGVINSFLVSIGVREPGDPVQWLLYGPFAVMLVLGYAWIPFVTLPMFVALDNLDRSFLEAAGDLGASRMRTLWRVTLPLSRAGIIAGFVFVFIPTIGEFVTPSLIGGPNGYMFGNAINDLFTRGLDWQTGSVLAMFLLIVVAILMAVFGRSISVRSVAS
jgi:spermidine/putrescine transport system permease protein